jgi:uncharacterized iron-regulated membrane protein
MFNFILFFSTVLILITVCFGVRSQYRGIWRRFWHKIHLWLGIISGITLFLICLSGTLLVFRLETLMFFEHDKYFVSHPDKSPLNLDDLIAKVEQNIDSKVAVVVRFNSRNDTAYRMSVKTEYGKDTGVGHHHGNEFYLIDPYTGDVLGNRSSPLFEFFRVVSVIHRTLFLPKPFGRIVVGSATLIFIIVALSGFCLWLPINFRNKKSWKNGLLIRFRKGKNQFIVNLHKMLGFYVLIPVLLMALTGLAWSFKWYNNGVQTIFHAQHIPNFPIKSPPQKSDAKRLPLEFFVKKADELIEHKGYWTFSIPERKDSPIIITERCQGILKLARRDRIQFDQYTGEVLRFEQFNDLPAGAKFVSLFYQLHTGEILGLPTKIIYFLACLIATTLPITGVMIWWRKLRNLHKAKNKTDDNKPCRLNTKVSDPFTASAARN